MESCINRNAISVWQRVKRGVELDRNEYFYFFVKYVKFGDFRLEWIDGSILYSFYYYNTGNKNHFSKKKINISIYLIRYCKSYPTDGILYDFKWILVCFVETNFKLLIVIWYASNACRRTPLYLWVYCSLFEVFQIYLIRFLIFS